MENYLISGPLKGIEKIWVLGDNFGHRSFNTHYFKRDDMASYAKDKYEVSGFFNNRFMSLDPNVVSRLRNVLVMGIKEQSFLPKMVVVVPDDDIVHEVNEGFYSSSISDDYYKVLHWIMKEHTHLVEAIKEYLPEKCKRVNYPHFVWIEAPPHNNFANNFVRHKFNDTLVTVTQLHLNTSVLKLKKIWDDTDSNLYIAESRRFMANGYATYWQAVDHTIKFCDMTILKRVAKQEMKQTLNAPITNHATHAFRNKFHWHKKDK